MFDYLLDGLIATLPTKVLAGCLVVAVIGVAALVLWYHYG